ncbi:MAG: HEPN domain-containing protein [Deltaproteobacteria bacterium]|nr:HEPN domain-containing protein [Deltaproteobacteria bacterium]
MKDKKEYWVDMAEYDLETAWVMLKGGRYLYVGFMCHQVIEKMFKGHYVLINNENPPFTHNLRYLAQQSGLFEKMDENQKDLVELVGPLNIEARYPTYKEKVLKALSKERCEYILKRTEELYQWTKNKL